MGNMRWFPRQADGDEESDIADWPLGNNPGWIIVAFR